MATKLSDIAGALVAMHKESIATKERDKLMAFELAKMRYTADERSKDREDQQLFSAEQQEKSREFSLEQTVINKTIDDLNQVKLNINNQISDINEKASENSIISIALDKVGDDFKTDFGNYQQDDKLSVLENLKKELSVHQENLEKVRTKTNEIQDVADNLKMLESYLSLADYTEAYTYATPPYEHKGRMRRDSFTGDPNQYDWGDFEVAFNAFKKDHIPLANSESVDFYRKHKDSWVTLNQTSLENALAESKKKAREHQIKLNEEGRKAQIHEIEMMDKYGKQAFLDKKVEDWTPILNDWATSQSGLIYSQQQLEESGFLGFSEQGVTWEALDAAGDEVILQDGDESNPIKTDDLKEEIKVEVANLLTAINTGDPIAITNMLNQVNTELPIRRLHEHILVPISGGRETLRIKIGTLAFGPFWESLARMQNEISEEPAYDVGPPVPTEDELNDAFNKLNKKDKAKLNLSTYGFEF